MEGAFWLADRRNLWINEIERVRQSAGACCVRPIRWQPTNEFR